MSSDEIIPTSEIVKPIRRSVGVLVIKMFSVLFLVDTVYAFLLLANAAGYVPVEFIASYATFLWIIYTVKYVVLTYILIKLVVDWTSTLYYIVDGHLIRQRGVLRTTETVFRLTDIQAVVMTQSALGRLLNFGSVSVTFDIARQTQIVYLYAINDPQQHENYFLKYV